MIESKLFYRELDSILAKIGQEKSGDHFFLTILNELQTRFGSQLSITDSHIFEMRGDEFVHIESIQEKSGATGPGGPIPPVLVKGCKIVQKVSKHGSFIFDNPSHQDCIRDYAAARSITPAGISIKGPEQTCLFIFELRYGWIREEIILFLNAVRTALNYRLFTETIGTELERAAEIQRSLLPRQAPKLKGYTIHQSIRNAEIIGGDFYEYFPFDEGTLAFSIGDASGHGLPAALLVRDVVTGLRMGLSRDFRLATIIQKLNEVIQYSLYSTNFVSLFTGELENDGHLFYVNAGHPPPFVVEKERVVELEATGIALGFLPKIELSRGYVQIKPGSVFVMYTDGITERENGQEEQFGILRLQRLIQENRHRSAQDLVDLVIRAVDDFGEQKPWKDDATVIVVKRQTSESGK
jgi:sigma-B regulation protein RsbU (phosphoserine phosphatase)